MSDGQLDPGDKMACALGFKKGLPNYSSFDWHVSITITKRDGESDEEFSLRGWATAQKELLLQMETGDDLIEKVKPVVGSPGDWN